jgi:hypothetical protein
MRNRWLLALLVNTFDLEPRRRKAAERGKTLAAFQRRTIAIKSTTRDTHGLVSGAVVVEGAARDVKAICALT